MEEDVRSREDTNWGRPSLSLSLSSPRLILILEGVPRSSACVRTLAIRAGSSLVRRSSVNETKARTHRKDRRATTCNDSGDVERCYSARQNGPSYCALLSLLNAIFPFGEAAYLILIAPLSVTVNHVALLFPYLIIFITFSCSVLDYLLDIGVNTYVQSIIFRTTCYLFKEKKNC